MARTLPDPNRRAILAGAAWAPLGLSGGVAAATVPATPPDALVLALCAELEGIERAYLALFDGPGAIDDDNARDAALVDVLAGQEAALARLCAAPCASLAGLLAKLRLLALMNPDVVGHEPDDGYHLPRLLGSVLRDVARVAG